MCRSDLAPSCSPPPNSTKGTPGHPRHHHHPRSPSILVIRYGGAEHEVRLSRNFAIGAHMPRSITRPHSFFFPHSKFDISQIIFCQVSLNTQGYHPFLLSTLVHNGTQHKVRLLRNCLHAKINYTTLLLLLSPPRIRHEATHLVLRQSKHPRPPSILVVLFVRANKYG